MEYKRLKQDKKLKDYKGGKNIRNPNESELGLEHDEMTEYVAKVVERKKPKRQLPRDNKIFS